ncbi:MAG: glutathione S-transferase family protein [Siculibacillus sp.]|nr:glutathione S-transferase family protein [Siculibacillus sp.]
MEPVRIVGVNFSNFVQSVLLALKEKGAAYELVPPPSGLKEPAHMALHPWGKIPVALLDSGPLYETTAILRWIDAALPGRSMTPSEPLAASRMEQWISAITSYLDIHAIRQIGSPMFFAARRGEAFEPPPAALEALDHDLTVFETALGHGPFLGGTDPNLADCLLAPIVNALALMPRTRPMLHARPALTGFLAAVHARPSCEGVLKKPA